MSNGNCRRISRELPGRSDHSLPGENQSLTMQGRSARCMKGIPHVWSHFTLHLSAPENPLTSEDAPPADKGILLARLGRFALGQLEAAGLRSIAEKIISTSNLTLDDLYALWSTSVSLLGKLVELRFGRKIWGQDLPVDQVGSSTGSADSTTAIGQPLGPAETFLQELLAIRDSLQESGVPLVWYPEVVTLPEQAAVAADEASGIQILRAIALARLVLPGWVQIRAPLAALGEKLSTTALEFGATQLGAVAADEATARQRNLPTPEDLAEMLTNRQPTRASNDSAPVRGEA